MDLQLSNPSPKSPSEPEPETHTRILPVKPLSFTNGVLKRHPPLHHPHHPIVLSYKECLKNHAANIGAHALDGCGEFMPSPTTTPTDPTSLKCAACGCHRNFHRREPDTTPTPTPTLEYHPQHRHHPLPPRGDSGSSDNNNSPSPPPISSTYYPSAPHVLLSLSHNMSGAPPENSRKRHRTRFSHEQKKRMLEFSEGLGWKMMKKDEDAINHFCGEIGVDRGVFKVWMHNNKNNYGGNKQKDQEQYPPMLLTGVNDHVVLSNAPPTTTAVGAVAATSLNGNNGFDYNISAAENVFDKEQHQHHVQAVGTNGSSSS